MNLSSTTPAAPAGKQNVAWQKDSLGNVSANVSTGAPDDAHYVTTQAEGSLSAEANLGALADNSVLAIDVAAGVATLRAATLTDLTGAMAAQNANKVLAGPTTGADAIPTYRTLVAADITGQPYDIPFFLMGKPPASKTIFRMKFARAVAFAANFSGSKGAAPDVNATSTTTFSVKKNGTEIGTIAVATAYTFATASGAAQSFAVDDVMTIVSPAQDATLEGVGFTLVGTR